METNNTKSPKQSNRIPSDLTPDELYGACAIGCHRRISSIFKRSEPQHYEVEENSEWSTEIESVCAELAFSKWKKCYWTGSIWNGKVAQCDAGSEFQVRHTVYDNGHLIVYKFDPLTGRGDRDQDRFVLVTGKAPHYFIRGWLYGHEAATLGEWKTDLKTPAYWVPQEALHPFYI